MAACSTYVLVGAVALLADPYCASLLGEGVMLDARAPMMAVILLLAPRPAVLVSIVCTVGAHTSEPALAWSDRWILCGPDTAGQGSMSWRSSGRPGSSSSASTGSNELARRARRPRRPGPDRGPAVLRAEEEAWVADTLASAQALLDDIAQGRGSPGAGRERPAPRRRSSSGPCSRWDRRR